MRAALTGLLAILLMAPAVTIAAPPARPSTLGRASTLVQTSDIPADPAVRYGVLANGMHYAILRNATPPGEASIRLRIDAGSLHEREDQRGLAHFLEHMVLNGTRNVPEGDFVKRLERAGLRLGADTNAVTTFNETVFKLDLPKADDATLGEALFLLREVADEATLDPKAIDRERGIVQAEERTRANPGYRAAVDSTGFVFKDRLVSRRFPIGLAPVIASASRAQLAEFYHAYYRPERATFVVVGDVDPDAMEAKIRAAFAGWKGEGHNGPDPDPGTLSKRGIQARILAEHGLPSSLSVTWLQPYEDRPDSVALRRDQLFEVLGLSILKRRYERIAAGGQPGEAPPFVAAAVGHGTSKENGAYTSINAVTAPGQWRPALAAIDQEQRRLVTYGVLRSELAREIAGFRLGLTAAVAATPTRGTRGLADALTGAIGREIVFNTPAYALSLFESIVKDLTPEQVSAALRPLFSGEGPLFYMTSPTPVPEGEAGLLAAYAGSVKTAVAAPVAPVAKRFPYATFGKAGTVAERRDIGGGIDATAVRFANGTRLTVKPTAFKKDQILVSVRFGNGRLGLKPDAALPGPLSAAVIGGGLGDLTYDELQQTFAPIVSGIAFGIGNEAFALSGSTRPVDFATQMRLLAAYLTDPAWRPTAWDRARALGPTAHDAMESTPGGVLMRDLGALIASGDRRWHSATREEIARSRVEDARALLADDFADAPVEVTIVGDVTLDEAIQQTAATFGALTGRGTDKPPAPGGRIVRFPAPVATPVVRTHTGRGDQASAFIAWPTADFHSDPRRARMLGLLAQVMQLRLTDEVREKQGASYSPSVGSTESTTFTGYGYLSASIQVPPAKLAGFLADAQRIATELGDKPPTPDELDRARRPMIASINRARGSSNGWWMGALNDIQTDPRAAADFATLLPDIEAATPADLQQLARQYLRADKAWKMIVVPEASGTVPGVD